MYVKYLNKSKKNKYGNKYKISGRKFFKRIYFSIEDYCALLANLTQTSYFLYSFFNTATLVVCNGVNSPLIPVNPKLTDFIWLSSIFLAFWNFGASSHIKGSALAPGDCNTILDMEAVET